MAAYEHNGYIRSGWYAAALSREVGRKPFQAWLLDEPLVLFRKQNHEAVVLRDRCPHRHAPLSLGTVVGDEIQCRYHGFQFDCAGRCTKIPGEKVIPRAVQVQSLPTLESFGFLWVWTGDPAKADPALLPEFPWTDTPGFSSVHFSGSYEAPFRLLMDNLMDMTHVHFVHSLLGAGNLVHDEPIRVWEENGRVLYRRDVPRGKFLGSAGSSLVTKATDEGVYMEFSGEFIPPSIIVTQIIPRREGTDEIETSTPMARVMHCITPRKAELTAHLAVRSMNLSGRPHEIAAIEHMMRVTQGEDKTVIEGQHQNRCAAPQELEEKLVKADKAAVMAQRMYEKVLRAERETQPESARDVEVPVS